MMDTVIFDMDGLLVNSEPLWEEAMAIVFTQMGIHLKKSDYRKTTGLPTVNIVAYWRQYFDFQGKSDQQVKEEVHHKVKELIAEKSSLKKGVQYILDFFKEKDFKIGLASSSPEEMIKMNLERFKLNTYFSAVHSGEHHQYGKPHPSVYLSCAQELGTAPTHCIVFEDSVNGMIAAKAARMKVVAVPEKHNWSNPKYALADLELHALTEFKTDHLTSLGN